MQFNIVDTTKQFEITPKVFLGGENPPKFTFRYPTTGDFIFRNTDLGDFYPALNRIFVKIENVEFVDANGNIKPIEKYDDIFKLSCDSRFLEAHQEITEKISSIMDEIQKEGIKTEKKSKSAGKSAKQAKQN